MMSRQTERKITGALLALTLLDLMLSGWAWLFPELWFSFFHGAAHVDPQALLTRCGANWFAFFVLQAIALVRFRRETWWLAVVAGCRLGDALTDVTCLLTASGTTWAAWVAFPLAGAGNLIIGVLLLRWFRALAPTVDATSPRRTPEEHRAQR